MKIDSDISTNIVESVKKTLQSFHSHRRKARIYAKRFLNGFSDNDRDFILNEILYNQNKSIIEAISNRKNIAIPTLGSFQYRESLEIIREIKNEIKKKYGVLDIRKADQSIIDAIIKEIEEKKKEIIIPLYFKQLGGKGSTVNSNFKKK